MKKSGQGIKKDIQYIGEKIDMGSVDSIYVGLLLFLATALLTFFVAFSNKISSHYFLTIFISIIFLSLFISLFFEIRSVFNGNINDKLFSFIILIVSGSVILMSAVLNLLYFFNPKFFSKLTLSGKIVEIVASLVIIFLIVLFIVKIKKWFKRKFPLHVREITQKRRKS